MKIVDANVLLYAVNSDASRHEPARRWLDTALSGADTVGFAWVVMLAFLRLTTKPGLFPRPLSVSTATRVLDGWSSAPGAVVVHPGVGHATRLGTLLSRVGHGANLVSDAHLVAIALEQRGEIVSYDSDFLLFPDVHCRRPDELL